MNLPKILIDAAVQCVADGGVVLIIDKQGSCGDIKRLVDQLGNRAIKRISKANGNERIDVKGSGSIRWIPHPSWARGISADQIYYAPGLTQDDIFYLIQALATAEELTLIGYH